MAYETAPQPAQPAPAGEVVPDFHQRFQLLVCFALMLSGCSGISTATDDPMGRPLTNDVVRAEVKACKAVGMVPELITVNHRTVWVQCWLPKDKP